jgi:hypothetical protein
MNKYYKILLSEYIKPPSNMIIENIEGLSGSMLKSFIRHNNIVKAYIEYTQEKTKEKIIIYIKSQLTVNAGYDEKQRIESLIKYVSENKLSFYFLM